MIPAPLETKRADTLIRLPACTSKSALSLQTGPPVNPHTNQGRAPKRTLWAATHTHTPLHLGCQSWGGDGSVNPQSFRGLTDPYLPRGLAQKKEGGMGMGRFFAAHPWDQTHFCSPAVVPFRTSPTLPPQPTTPPPTNPISSTTRRQTIIVPV